MLAPPALNIPALLRLPCPPDRATMAKWCPWRHMVARRIHFANNSRFEKLPHPGWSNFSHVRTLGAGYARHMAQYAACLTDGSAFDYVVAKVGAPPAWLHECIHGPLDPGGSLMGSRAAASKQAATSRPVCSQPPPPSNPRHQTKAGV